MISIRMSETAEKKLREVAKFEGVSVSEYVRRLIREKLEDLYDIEIATSVLEEYEKEPATYSMDDVFGEDK